MDESIGVEPVPTLLAAVGTASLGDDVCPDVAADFVENTLAIADGVADEAGVGAEADLVDEDVVSAGVELAALVEPAGASDCGAEGAVGAEAGSLAAVVEPEAL